MTETSCNQLLLIQSAMYVRTYTYARQDQFASYHNVAVSIYDIIAKFIQ